MDLYTILNLLILVFPLALSFDRKVAFWRRWPRVAGSVLCVGSAFIAWDVIVTRDGHWSFDPLLAGSFRLLGLPPGELLFFAAVPYACMFILEVVRAYTKDGVVALPRLLPASLGALSLAGAAFAAGRGYTFIVLSSLALVLGLMAGPAAGLFRRRSTWLAFAISYFPFLIFNGIFTALPIVSYAPDMILGPRVWSIPVEDFAYSFCLLGLSFMVYEWLGLPGKKRP